MTTMKQTLLSSFISPENTGKKISAVGKDITRIDSLINNVNETTSLYLSRNSLHSLDGVQQFTSLESLSVADNRLSTFEDIRHLSSCKQLKNVNLEDNPVTELPNYRHFLIHMLMDSLKTLDGRPVTQQEKHLAPKSDHLYHSLLTTAINTACIVHKIGRSIQITRLHQELHRYISMGFDQSNKISFPSHYYQYDASSLTSTEYSLLENAIVHEVLQYEKHPVTASSGSSKNNTATCVLWWHAAFMDVLSRQVDSIQNLITTLTTIQMHNNNNSGDDNDNSVSSSDQINQQYNEIQDTLHTLTSLLSTISSIDIHNNYTINDTDTIMNEFITKQHQLLSLLAIYYKSDEKDHNDDDDDDYIAELYNTDGDNEDEYEIVDTINQQKKRGVIAYDDDNTIDASWSIPVAVDDDNAVVSTDIMMIMDSTTTTDDNNINTITVSTITEQQQERIEQLTNDYDNLHIKLLDMKQHIDEKDATISLYKQEIASQQHALTSLQSWLETANNATTDAENRCTQERAMHAMERASLQSEINYLRNELESMQTIHHAQQDIIVELSSKLHDAATANRVAVDPVLMNIHVSYEHELNAKMNENDELKRQVGEYYDEVLDLKRQLSLTIASNEMKERRCLQSALSTWQSITTNNARLRMIKHTITTNHNHHYIRNALQLWKQATIRMKQIDTMKERKNMSSIRHAFYQWRDNARSRILFRGLDHAANAHYSLSLVHRMFTRWSSVTAMYCQVNDDDRVDAMHAVMNRRHAMQIFSRWRLHAQQIAVVKEAKQLLADAHRETAVVKSLFSAWQSTAVQAKEERIDEQRGDIAHRRLVLRRVLCVWQRPAWRAMSLRVAERELKRKIDGHMSAQVVSVWCEWTQVQKELRRNIEREQSLRHMRVVFDGWRAGADVLKRERKIEKKVEIKAKLSDYQCLRNALYAWICVINDAKVSRQRSDRAIRSMQRWKLTRMINTWRLVTLTHAYTSLSQCIPTLQNELSAKHKDIVAMSEQISLLIVQLEQLMQESVDKDAWMENTRIAMSTLQSEHERAQQEADNLLIQEKESHVVLELQLQAQTREFETALEQFEEMQKKAGNALHQLNEEKQRVEKQLEELSRAHDELQSKYSMLNDEYMQKTALCCDVQEQNEQLLCSQQQLENQVTKAESMIVDLQSTVEELEKEIDAVQRRYVASLHTQSTAEENSRVALKMTQRLAALVEQQHHELLLLD